VSLRAALAGVAATLLGGAGLVVPLVASAPSASAATCSSTSGVGVVVDFDELGGGVRSSCVAGGGGQLASQLFPSAGHPLTYAQRQPGFVCRVNAVPASDPCVNTSPDDAYWSLWVSDGDPGSAWRYAGAGATSLRVSDGQLVAFHWNQGDGRQAPGASAQRPAPPSSSGDGSRGSGGSGGSAGAGGSGSAGAGGAPSTAPDGSTGDDAGGDPGDGAGGGPRGGGASPRDGRGPRADAGGGRQDRGERGDRAGRGGARSDERSDRRVGARADDAGAQEETGGPQEEIGSREPAAAQDAATQGLPGWVAPAAAVLVLLVAGAVVLLRRRSAATR